MICEKEIEGLVAHAKCCAADMANQYVLKANYGDKSRDAILDRILMIKSLIRTFERYNYFCSIPVVSNGEMTFNGVNVLLSDKNSLSLELNDDEIQLTQDDFNCITEEELCNIAEKLKVLCSTC